MSAPLKSAELMNKTRVRLSGEERMKIQHTLLADAQSQTLW